MPKYYSGGEVATNIIGGAFSATRANKSFYSPSPVFGVETSASAKDSLNFFKGPIISRREQRRPQ